MSFISWLFPQQKTHRSRPAAESSGLSRMDATRPVMPRRGQAAQKDAAQPATSNAQPANRKGERMARRELLYTVVRESMMRAGVLSSSYKFKVLSLDPRGRQFLVMVDLAAGHGGETGRLAEIEALIAQAAKARYDILVSAVYWRMNEHVAVGAPGTHLPKVAPMAFQPMPLDGIAVADSEPAALEMPQARPTNRFEPIEADEVAAFKQALAEGVGKTTPVVISRDAHADAQDRPNKHAPQSYTLLTGFEDTEMPETDPRAPALSCTQYGELN